ncbi:MAG: hypothetical protein V9G12_11230 [Microthrixaceae bacterium]
MSTVPAETLETASAVRIRTSGMPLGFGATTHGWRPISVNIQPNALARNGVAITAIVATGSHFHAGRSRPRRVRQRPATAPKAAMAPNRIIRRNAQ